MIHRAPFGSMERFCGVLIEHFAGHFPAWLSPEQARVLTVSEKSDAFAQEVMSKLTASGLRASLDNSSDKIGAKIRNAQLEKTPYMLVIGERKKPPVPVSPCGTRRRVTWASDRLEELIESIKEEVRSRTL